MILMLIVVGLGFLLFQMPGEIQRATGMDGNAIASVTIPVVALTQIAKWSGLPDARGPLVVLGLSGLGVGLWAWSEGAFMGSNVFALFTGWALVATSSAGVFGFTRATPEAVTATKQPPAGAGSNETAK